MDERVWLTISVLVHPKGVDGVEVRTLAKHENYFLQKKNVLPCGLKCVTALPSGEGTAFSVGLHHSFISFQEDF